MSMCVLGTGNKGVRIPAPSLQGPDLLEAEACGPEEVLVSQSLQRAGSRGNGRPGVVALGPQRQATKPTSSLRSRRPLR